MQQCCVIYVTVLIRAHYTFQQCVSTSYCMSARAICRISSPRAIANIMTYSPRTHAITSLLHDTGIVVSAIYWHSCTFELVGYHAANTQPHPPLHTYTGIQGPQWWNAPPPPVAPPRTIFAEHLLSSLFVVYVYIKSLYILRLLVGMGNCRLLNVNDGGSYRITS